MTPEQQLSESLLAACKAAGIEKPKYIAQDEDGAVWHYDGEPDTTGTSDVGIFAFDPDIGEHAINLDHPPYADDWKESLMEWVEPQGEPLADVLAQHANLIGDDTEMVILYNVAETSKKIDDACKIAYQNHLRKGDGLCWSRADCYRAAWQDALAWKAIAEKGGEKL
jgi:hypothetical protein